MPEIIEREKNVLLLILPRYAKIKPQQELVNQLKIENNVRFITEDVAIEEYVNLADMVALPYLNLIGTEGNPSCMLEAMASKTKVVTTDLAELREIGEGSVLFAKPSDPKSLAETILAMLSLGEPETNQMLEKAYEKSQEFDRKKIAQQFFGLYNSLLEK